MIQNQITLSDNDLNATKTILLNFENKHLFTWEQFHYVSKQQFSKQYTLSLLNNLVDKNILEVSKVKKINYYHILVK